MKGNHQIVDEGHPDYNGVAVCVLCGHNDANPNFPSEPCLP